MKRVLALVLCICILFSLTACGSKKVEGGFVSLYSDMISISEAKSSVELSLSLNDVDSASLLLASMTYLKERGNLSGFETVKETYVENAKKFVSFINDMTNSYVSLNGDVEHTSNKDMFGELSLRTGAGKTYDSSIGVFANSLFVDSETLLGLYENYLSKSASLSAEELSETLMSLKDTKYVKFTLDSFNTSSLKDYSAKCASIKPYLNTFIVKYATSVVTENDQNSYNVSFCIDKVKEYLKGTYDIIKDNPGEFFDCARELVVVAKSVDLIEGTECALVEELLEASDDVKKARKTFVKSWESKTVEDFYNEVLSDNVVSFIEHYKGTEIKMGISKVDDSYKYSVDLKLCVNSINALSIKIDSSVVALTNSISLAEFDGSMLYETFVEKMTNLLKLKEEVIELPTITDIEDNGNSIEKPSNPNVLLDTDAIINVVPIANIDGLALKLDMYNLSYRGAEIDEIKDFLNSDFKSIASSVGFDVNKIKETSASDYYEMSVSNEDASLLTKLSLKSGKLNYTVKIPYVKPMIALQKWLKDVTTLTGLNLGNSYTVEMLKMAEDGVVSNDYLSYNMTSINETLEYSITYSESEEYAIINMNIYTYLF